MSETRTLFSKIFNAHIIQELGDNNYLVLVDRCMLHELGGEPIFQQMDSEGLKPFCDDFIVAIEDHTISGKPGRTGDTPTSARFVTKLEDGCRKYNIPLIDIKNRNQGIVHVVAPQQGIVQPGMTFVCGDSHTCTNGAMGALSWGAGSSVISHVIATHSVIVQKPKTLRVNIEGTVPPGITAMDIILYIISKLGAAYGVGYAIEWAGSVVRSMTMEERFTVCNLSVEFGSEYGVIGVDEKTIDYVLKTPGAPAEKYRDQFVAYCQTLHTDEGAVFDKEVTLDISDITPQIGWGTTPSHATSVYGTVPEDHTQAVPADESRYTRTLEYMGVKPGEALLGKKIDKVFIGSCTNGRLSNLHTAAAVAKGRKVAPWVEAWVIPGSQEVKRIAEQDGTAEIFRQAGFIWGEPCCAYCACSNGEVFPPESEVVSTTNRNFMHRQGPGVRTHLASPDTAAACAVKGYITTAECLRKELGE